MYMAYFEIGYIEPLRRSLEVRYNEVLLYN